MSGLSGRAGARPCRAGAAPISIKPLTGGVSNASFNVKDETGKYVARVGEDYPVPSRLPRPRTCV